MDAKELAALGAKTVRRDEKLLRQYIEEYAALFGSAPNCVSCSFSRDFKKFQREVNKEQKTKTMKNKTFQLKKKHNREIHTYRENGRPRRIYGHRMTEDFAQNFLTNGSEKEIEERKKLFDVLPKGIEGEKAVQKEETKTEATREDEIANQSVKNIAAEVEKIKDLELLERLLNHERIQDRKTAVNIVQERIDEIKE